MSDKRMSWNEIVHTYPDTWVGLSKIDWDNPGNVRSAVVLGTSDTGDEFLGRQIAGEDVYTRYTTPNRLY